MTRAHRGDRRDEPQDAARRGTGVKFAQKLGLGYHHSLSKRTTIYADVGHDSEAATSKTGYDLGLIHTF